MKTRTIVIALAVVSLVAGCGLFNPRGSWDPFAAPEERQLLVRIQNQGPNEVAVFAVTPGRRESLGMVSGRSQTRVLLSWPRAETVRFQLEPIAERRYNLDGGFARPGDRIDIYIQDPITRSFVSR